MQKILALPHSLRDWGTEAFTQTLKREIESLSGGSLPLEKGTQQGGLVDDSHLTVTVIRCTEDANNIIARIGVFFTEIVICCGCGDDPMPINAFCEMAVKIDKVTAETAFSVTNN